MRQSFWVALVVAVSWLASGCAEVKPDCLGAAVVCGGTCAELKSDNLNCGGCGTVCAAGKVCSSGACAVTCAAGEVNCGGSCVDPLTDRIHCGATATCSGAAAGTACGDGEVCSAGGCGLTCQAGLLDCNGKCVDPQTDRAFCGASGSCTGATGGVVCGSGEICTEGACVPSCLAGQVLCGGKCVDPSTDRAYCGASGACTGVAAGAACASGQVCSAGACALSCQAGLTNCGGECANALTDNRNCGGCGLACGSGQVCSNGACALTCQPGLVNCGGKCVDPLADRSYCGASDTCTGGGAGAVCGAGQVCSAGACALSCQPGLVDCGGVCADPLNDPRYCGADLTCGLGQTCGAGSACEAGQCVLSCQPGLVNCAGKCVDPQTDRAYCGASGTCGAATGGAVCAAGQVCNAGACVTSCPGGEQACGGKCVDPQTDPNYCGASAACTGGTACGPSAGCYQGRCEPLCAAGQVMCNGSCISPLTDASFCGASGYCTGASAGVVCSVAQTCVAGACTPPPCLWTELWTAPLSSLPAGATARKGSLGAIAYSVVGSRTAFTTTSDWAEILAPANLAPADDLFAVQADFYATAVTLGASNFRSTGLYALTDIYNFGQQHGLWAGFREKLGQPTQFQWVVSPATLPASGWDGWDLDIPMVSTLAQSAPATLPLAAWHTLRVEGSRSRCRFQARLDGVVISTWAPASCDVAGTLVGVSAARSQPLNVAWSNLAVYKGSATTCIP